MIDNHYDHRSHFIIKSFDVYVVSKRLVGILIMLLQDSIKSSCLTTIKTYRASIRKIHKKTCRIALGISAHGNADRIIITTKCLGTKLAIARLTGADGGVTILNRRTKIPTIYHTNIFSIGWHLVCQLVVLLYPLDIPIFKFSFYKDFFPILTTIGFSLINQYSRSKGGGCPRRNHISFLPADDP